MNHTILFHEAKRWRNAIEQCKTELSRSFVNFPFGSCGDASLTLGSYLSEIGFGEFEYILGSRGAKDDGSWESHAWIENKDVIVDITADQFPDNDQKVIVVQHFHSPWHERFNGSSQHIANYSVFGATPLSNTARDFYIIKRNLEATQ